MNWKKNENKKKLIKIAIDSPAAAGAGTLANQYQNTTTFYILDTGKIYRMIAFIKLIKKKNLIKNS